MLCGGAGVVVGVLPVAGAAALAVGAVMVAIYGQYAAIALLMTGSVYTAVDCTPGPCDRVTFRRLEISGAGAEAGYAGREYATGVNNNDYIAQHEVFGPVVAVIKVDSDDEAIEIANDTPYGLTNYVQTQDAARANRMARALRSGMVEMNYRPRGPGAPFGGIGASGDARLVLPTELVVRQSTR